MQLTQNLGHPDAELRYLRAALTPAGYSWLTKTPDNLRALLSCPSRVQAATPVQLASSGQQWRPQSAEPHPVA